MAASNFDVLFPYIRSISYPRNKTKHLLGLSNMLVTDFGEEVPLNIDDLQRMPGVGRKTANVIVSVLDQQPAMAVDTHVFRVSKRLGLVTLKAKTPQRLSDSWLSTYLMIIFIKLIIGLFYMGDILAYLENQNVKFVL